MRMLLCPEKGKEKKIRRKKKLRTQRKGIRDD